MVQVGPASEAILPAARSVATAFRGKAGRASRRTARSFLAGSSPVSVYSVIRRLPWTWHCPWMGSAHTQYAAWASQPLKTMPFAAHFGASAQPAFWTSFLPPPWPPLPPWPPSPCCMPPPPCRPCRPCHPCHPCHPCRRRPAACRRRCRCRTSYSTSRTSCRRCCWPGRRSYSTGRTCCLRCWPGRTSCSTCRTSDRRCSLGRTSCSTDRTSCFRCWRGRRSYSMGHTYCRRLKLAAEAIPRAAFGLDRLVATVLSTVTAGRGGSDGEQANTEHQKDRLNQSHGRRLHGASWGAKALRDPTEAPCPAGTSG